MKSLFFISLMNGDAWGGSEELWYQTALYAAANGADVACAVYAWPAKKERLNNLINAGVKVYELPNDGRHKSTFRERFTYKFITPICLRKAIQHLPVSSYDLVIINQGGISEIYSGPWKYFYKKLRQYAILFHNYQVPFQIKPYKQKLLQAWVKHATICLFASVKIQEVIEKTLGISLPNTAILINPISFATPAQVTPFPPLYKGNYCFTMLAALEVHRKAQDVLLHTLSSEKWLHRNWILNLYGAGRDLQLLGDLIHLLKLQDKVFLKGHANHVQEVLSNSHLLMHCTKMDAMPLSIIEAMSMSRPVLATSVGDIPHWVKDEKNGWVANECTSNTLDAVLEKAWMNRNSWEDMGKESYMIFRDKFPESPPQHLLQMLA